MSDGQVMFLEDASQINVVHYSVCAEGETHHHLACTPNLDELEARLGRPWPYRRSNDPRAVNCPTCQATKEYRKIVKLLEAHQQLLQGPVAVPSVAAVPARGVQTDARVHFVYREQAAQPWEFACCKEDVRGDLRRSDDPRGVDCAACRATTVWQAARDHLRAVGALR